MRIELRRRQKHSVAMSFLAPVLAIALTLVTGFFIFLALGKDPFYGLYVFFLEPLLYVWSLEELVVKAVPLILIALGLSLCYRANAWNIGAEGQFTVGAITGSIIPVFFHTWESPVTLPLMLVCGVVGGMAYAAIPAFLKNRFGTSEILTSLMLVYVAQQLLDFLVRGPFRNPEGFNYPETRVFSDAASVPVLIEGTRVNIGAVLVVIAVIAIWILLKRSLAGFAIDVVGEAPRAGRFAGFDQKRIVLLTFLVSGGLAGLAGILEAAGPLGQLRPTLSPGYGFTAIIVAFLGRLNPFAIVVAGVLIALSYLGGEATQISLRISEKMARVFQGMLLFYVLACNTFILNQVRIVRTARRAPVEVAHGHG